MKSSERPVFGNLSGLKVISASSVIAGPFICALFAEQGADVIQLENPRMSDMLRKFGDEFWSAERRNQRMASLDIPSEKGREVLFRMAAWADILVESSKGGTWKKWGITDELLWEHNPALVIVHVSGFGQTGDPAYIGRAAFDPVAQSFSGIASINGMPEPQPPYIMKPFTGDYVTGLMGAWAALAAYISARETGKGESIDLSQYESLVRLQGNYLSNGVNRGIQAPRMGNEDPNNPRKGTERCKDGWCYVSGGGAGTISALVNLLGMQDEPDFQQPIQVLSRKNKAAVRLTEKLSEWCAEHTVDEVESTLSGMGIACSRMLTYSDMLTNPHYIARETITEWKDELSGRTIKGTNAFPYFKNNPSRIFRGGAAYCADTGDVMRDMGYTDSEIAELAESGVIRLGD